MTKPKRIEQLLEQTYRQADERSAMDERILNEASTIMKQAHQANRPVSTVSVWRRIMRHPITKAAAVLTLCTGLIWMSWQSPSSHSNETASTLSFFKLITTACAAEQGLFAGDTVVHITHEITLYPNPDASDVPAQLKELVRSNFQLDKNETFWRAWFTSYAQLPIHTLKPDGRLGWHLLELSEATDQACIVQEHVWYDPDTGCFARLFKQADLILLAVGFDGEALYSAQADEDGKLKILRDPITESFRLPDNPAEYLGIATTFQDTVDMMNLPPVEARARSPLTDGHEADVYTLRWPDTDASHVFTVDAQTRRIEQIESYVKQTRVQQVRRISSDTAESLECSWHLTELAGQSTSHPSDAVMIEGSVTITPQQMVNRSDIDMFVFGRRPDLIEDQTITETLDKASPLGRIFTVFGQTGHGLDAVLIQGPTVHQYIESAFSMAQKAAFRWTPTLFTNNRFKVRNTGYGRSQQWWAGLAFKSYGVEVAQACSTYVLESPLNTNLVLCVNGQVTDQELKALIGTLVPAALASDPDAQVDWYMNTDLDAATYQGFVPGEFLKDWLVLGSFPVFEGEPNFTENFSDNDTQLLAFDQDPFDIHAFEPSVTVQDQTRYWEHYRSPADIVDLAWPLGQQNFANAYALARIEMTEDTPVLLAVGDDDRIKVWVNEELVHEDRDGGHLVPDKAFVPATLKQGTNDILLKIQNGITEWQFTFRIFDADYNPLALIKSPTPESVTYHGLNPGEFMKQWLLLGPIPLFDDPNFQDKALEEAAFKIDHLPAYDTFVPAVDINDQTFTWQAYQSYTGIVDIHRAWPQEAVNEQVAAYAWAQIDMPEDTPVRLGIGSNDAVKVWLNGDLIHDHWINRMAVPDSDVVEALLRRGSNQLVIKIQNRTERWRFCCRLLQ
ncbi:MAG: hypothetical protein K9N55_13735 [Phycisphaerae bacterium]|nr:hypothetical protein [Phycisphaerae bacterium]